LRPHGKLACPRASRRLWEAASGSRSQNEHPQPLQRSELA
jgi:hypothetical protein